MSKPPRDSMSLDQGAMAASLQEDLTATLVDLLQRVREELAYNAAKGSGPYRQGMHDGLRFTEDALIGVLEPYVGQVEQPDRPLAIGRMDA